MLRNRAAIVFLTCLVIGSAAGTAMAQSSIDGIWHGAYTSTYSPKPTKEILMFETIDDDHVAGVYLSQSAAAGTLKGVGSGNTYAFHVTEPAPGCPGPAMGVLHVEVKGDQMKYIFQASSCKGTDVGHGEAKRGAEAPWGDPSSKLSGFWQGEYSSTYSPKLTQETIFFGSFDNEVVGVYLSKSGATGILTGLVSGDDFTLYVSAPSPPCPSHGFFNGYLLGDGKLNYSFSGADCKGQKDQGKGQGKKFAP